MPIPLALIGTGISAAGALAKAIPNKAERENNRRRKALEKLEQQDKLGLGGREREALTSSRVDPVRRAALQTRRQAEAMQATTGGSAADLARLRREQTAAIGEAEADARIGVELADQQRRRQQLQELEQRTAATGAAQEARKDALLNEAAQFANIMGQTQGAAPIMDAVKPVGDYDTFTSRLRDMGMPQEQIDMLLLLEQRNPGIVDKVARQAMAGAAAGGE